MSLPTIIARIDQLKNKLEALRPLELTQLQRIRQKFRLEWTYHSNALEGNTLTLDETRAFLLHGLTAQGKPFKDYLDIKGHNEAIIYLEDLVRGQERLTEAVIRELHQIILVEPYEIEAVTEAGRATKKRIALGQYKTLPNHVRTSTGEIHYYATPSETPARMGELMAWYRQRLTDGDLQPLILAATFHYRFVSIHPFDDGNGRLARLLMNLILMQAGYVPLIVKMESKNDYLLALEKADAGELATFFRLIGQALIESLELYLRGARGDMLTDLADVDKQVALLQKRLDYEATDHHLVSRERLFENLIIPFLKKLITNCHKFEPLFAETTYQAGYYRTGNREWVGPQVINKRLKPPDLLESLLAETKYDLAVDNLSISCRLDNLLHKLYYAINFDLTIQLDKDKAMITIIYQLTDNHNNDTDIDAELLQQSYDYHYANKEIDELVISILNQIYLMIEQQINT